MHILIVEDDDRVARALRSALVRHGYGVTLAGDAGSALAERADAPALILLDLGLPDRDGVDLCRRLRGRSDVPIIAVTARGEERDRVTGLRAGADDYVVKPFGIAELLARMEAVLRRTGTVAPTTAVDVGDVHVDLARREVTVAGREILLTRKEFDLLAALARRRGEVVARDELLAERLADRLGRAVADARRARGHAARQARAARPSSRPCAASATGCADG